LPLRALNGHAPPDVRPGHVRQRGVAYASTAAPRVAHMFEIAELTARRDLSRLVLCEACPARERPCHPRVDSVLKNATHAPPAVRARYIA